MDWNRIFLWLFGVALVGLVIAAVRNAKGNPPIATAAEPTAPVNQSNTPANESVTQGRAYLMYNQGPWAFAPPVMNFLPSMIAPGGGSVLVTPANVGSPEKYGCFEC